MNCGRCSNEKKRTVTVAVLSQRRYFPIPAFSGLLRPPTRRPRVLGISGNFCTGWFRLFKGQCRELRLDEGIRLRGRPIVL
ncbi:hypothetical protein RchiOBHm_Chr6g0273381 [Rosa chinensis]|uniref:Uncharacterized protein n=1 Tax=Rosa chinensis TaxID=74649 RepID=A0A2P6PRG6_ROSCH|nr:hypothetical protein RchiOBHm_Chr6g0273381 [Rosa chinensis]